MTNFDDFQGALSGLSSAELAALARESTELAMVARIRKMPRLTRWFLALGTLQIEEAQSRDLAFEALAADFEDWGSVRDIEAACEILSAQLDSVRNDGEPSST